MEAALGRRRSAAEVAFGNIVVGSSRARRGAITGVSSIGTTGSSTATAGSTSGASGSTSGTEKSGKGREHGRNTEGGSRSTNADRKDSPAIGGSDVGSDVGSESGRDSASAASADFTHASSAISPSLSPLSSSPSSPSLASLLSQHHQHLQQWQQHLDRAVFTPLIDPTHPLAVLSKTLKNSPKVPVLVAVDGRVPDAVAGWAWEQAGGRMVRVTWRKAGGREAGKGGETEGGGVDQREVEGGREREGEKAGDGDTGDVSRREKESVGAGEERRVEGGGMRRRLGVLEKRKWNISLVKAVGTSKGRPVHQQEQEKEQQQRQEQEGEQQQQEQRQQEQQREEEQRQQLQRLVEGRQWREGVKARAVSCVAMLQQHEGLQGRLAQAHQLYQQSHLHHSSTSSAVASASPSSSTLSHTLKPLIAAIRADLQRLQQQLQAQCRVDARDLRLRMEERSKLAREAGSGSEGLGEGGVGRGVGDAGGGGGGEADGRGEWEEGRQEEGNKEGRKGEGNEQAGSRSTWWCSGQETGRVARTCMGLRAPSPLARLSPHLFPSPPPAVSFLLQYFRQPGMIADLLARPHNCTWVPRAGGNKKGTRKGKAGGMGSVRNGELWRGGSVRVVEMLVHADSPEEWREWREYWCGRKPLTNPAAPAGAAGALATANVTFDHNAHEIRGFNTHAKTARGNVVTLLQDDDLLPWDCSWLWRITHEMDARPLVAAVGYRTGKIDVDGSNWGAPLTWYRFGGWLWTHPSYDPRANLRGFFAGVVDFAPFVMRRDVFLALGGLDEGLSARGECGIITDWHFTYRIWFAGYQVMNVAWDPPESGIGRGVEGGTHAGVRLSLRHLHFLINDGQMRRHQIEALNAWQQREVKRVNVMFRTLDVWE
ncbi:unnamed protein product [Closterium sp. Naga37s-1]|nr:unnamed protein product [Closterium sp. Naga37s-1]